MEQGKKKPIPAETSIADTQRSLYRMEPRRGRFIFSILIMAVVFLATGTFAPMISFSKFFIFTNEVSLFSGIVDLFVEGYYILFVMILGFSLILPIVKIIFIMRVLFSRFNKTVELQKYLKIIVQYGKWSMLDVFVAAVLIVTIKLGAIADVEVHIGLYLFAASVILTIIASIMISSLLNRWSLEKE